MKNIYTTFVLLLAFVIPTGNILAYNSFDNYQEQILINNLNGINNGINNLNSAISRNTKATEDAKIQQQIDALDPECVRQSTDYVNQKDQYIKEVNAEIDTLNVQMKNSDMSDPIVVQRFGMQLNDQYVLRDRQNKYYKQLIINSCINYKAPQKTNDQICGEKFGLNIKWDGKYCQCNSGYILNEQRTSCIIAPVVPVKTNDQICSENYLNSKWDSKYNISNGSLECDCNTGFQ